MPPTAGSNLAMVIACSPAPSPRVASMHSLGDNSLPEHAYMAHQKPTLQSWHRRLGHANYRAVYDLARSGNAIGMPIVHVDLMEHPDTVSAAGNKYIMDIIDDHSSYAWAIPLAAKSDAFPALQTWALAR
ncbi:hypothetical protein F4604DRAFT_2019325, partial [Suillus subluteus]